MNWQNKVTEILKTQYPIIQAPMFGVSTPEMVVSASEVGCLGSLPMADLPADKCIELIELVKTRTDKPFAANIFVYDLPVIDQKLKDNYKRVKSFIETLAQQHQLDVVLPEIDDLKFSGYRDLIDVIISADCKILSFTFGIPDKVSLQKLKENKVILIGTCLTVQEAVKLEKSGIDIICVQGSEAGGHRGNFLAEKPIGDPGIALLQKVSAVVSIPLIYAGGVYTGHQIINSQSNGAQGYQVGSLLLGTPESALTQVEKNRLQAIGDNDIVLTKSFSGRYASGIKNVFTQAIDDTVNILPFPFQNKLTAELRRISKINHNTDFVNIWAGKNFRNSSESSTAVLLKRLIKETEEYSNN
ncbi:nitronate monooxygenase [Chryseobacterium sp. C39-AII1]|uniref:NAD(P)H-dependent flavin oxidoreductase n=1 Tax=Chryseobacterium sp. C39-AII1 TaxID=3080332 RepID=UPI0032082075